MATAIKFSAVSASSGEVYELVAEKTKRGLRFTCTCTAGELGQFCKHRAAIICDASLASNNLSAADIAIFKGWLESSQIVAFLDSIATAEEDIKNAKKQVTMLKRELGRRLHDGTA